MVEQRNAGLRRYWFEFAIVETAMLPAGIALGCGVTAWTAEDALRIIQTSVFGNQPMPEIVRTVEDIDVSTLDAGHVLPNMAPPSLRGVWFPLGYDQS